jgi:hypothetical protein
MRANSVLLILAWAIIRLPANGQFVVRLSPDTLRDFEAYAGKVKQQLEHRWSSGNGLLAIDSDPDARRRVLQGEVIIRQMNDGEPVSVTGGLIHDWVGTIYIPGRSPEQVVNLLEDFDQHKDIYPAVVQSKLIRRDDHHVVGYWQLRQKGIITVTLDVEEEATYQKISAGKWKGEAWSRKITENDKKFDENEGHGYLWRLYSYWTLEEFKGGTVAECRTLSLSRSIPGMLAWAVKPYVEKIPRESLSSTLKETRSALER